MALPHRLNLWRGAFDSANLSPTQTTLPDQYRLGNVVTTGTAPNILYWMCTAGDVASDAMAGATEAPNAESSQWMLLDNDDFRTYLDDGSFLITNSQNDIDATVLNIQDDGAYRFTFPNNIPAGSRIDNAIYLFGGDDSDETDVRWLVRGSNISQVSSVAWDVSNGVNNFVRYTGTQTVINARDYWVARVLEGSLIYEILDNHINVSNLPTPAIGIANGTPVINPEITGTTNAQRQAAIRAAIGVEGVIIDNTIEFTEVSPQTVVHDVLVGAGNGITLIGPSGVRSFRSIASTGIGISSGSTEMAALAILTNTANFTEITPSGGDYVLPADNAFTVLTAGALTWQGNEIIKVQLPAPANTVVLVQNITDVPVTINLVGTTPAQLADSGRILVASNPALVTLSSNPIDPVDGLQIRNGLVSVNRAVVTTRWDARVTYTAFQTVVIRTVTGIERTFFSANTDAGNANTGVLPIRDAIDSAASLLVAPTWVSGTPYPDYELVTATGVIFQATPNVARDPAVSPISSTNVTGWTRTSVVTGSSNPWNPVTPTVAGSIAAQDDTEARGNPTTLNFGRNLTANDPVNGVLTIDAADSNTTYDFNNGTTVNTFTVEPSGLNEETITVTPGISSTAMFPTTGLILNQMHTIPADVTIGGTDFVAGIYELTQITPTAVWSLRARRNATSADGTITSVGAGAGLTSAGTSTAPVLNVGGSDSITVNADNIVVTNPFTTADETKLDGIDAMATRGVATINNDPSTTSVTGVETLTAGDGIRFTQQMSADGIEGGTTTITSTGTRHTITTGGSDSTAGTSRTADTIHFFTSPNDNPITNIGNIGGTSEIQVGIPQNTDTLVSRVEFANTAARNAANRVWRTSDLAIVGNTEYLFVGEATGSARTTADGDWHELGSSTGPDNNTHATYRRAVSSTFTGTDADHIRDIDGISYCPARLANGTLDVAFVSGSLTFDVSITTGVITFGNETPSTFSTWYATVPNDDNVSMIIANNTVSRAIVFTKNSNTQGTITQSFDRVTRLPSTTTLSGTVNFSVSESTRLVDIQSIQFGKQVTGNFAVNNATRNVPVLQNGFWTPVDASTLGGVSTLPALTDVTITNPTDEQVLTYDSTTSMWTNQAASGGGLTTSEIQVFRPTGTTNNDIADQNVTILLQIPQNYTSLVTTPAQTYNVSVNFPSNWTVGTAGPSGFLTSVRSNVAPAVAPFSGQLDTSMPLQVINAFRDQINNSYGSTFDAAAVVTNADGSFTLTITTDAGIAPGNIDITLRGFEGNFGIANFTGVTWTDNNTGVTTTAADNATRLTMASGSATGINTVANFTVNLDTITHPIDLGPFDLGTAANPLTTGVAALEAVRTQLIASGRYPSSAGYTIPSQAVVSQDGTTATLLITTTLPNSRLQGATEFSVSNSTAAEDTVVGSMEGGMLSQYAVTPPGGAMFSFNATSGETLDSYIDRLVVHINTNITGWNARREGDELHLISTTTAPISGTWTIVATHGGGVPDTRINFGTASETQAAGTTITGIDSTMTVNGDGQLGVDLALVRPTVFSQATRPTSNINPNDVWINTSTNFVIEGRGIGELAGTVFNPIVPNGFVLRGLRQVTTGGNTFVGLDLFEYNQGVSLATGVLSAGTYILVSPDGVPSTRMFSFGGDRLRVSVTGTDSVVHTIEDAISIRGIGNVIGTGVVTNPASVASAMGIELTNTYNSLLVQMSARTLTQSQPSRYLTSQIRVYAKGRHMRNSANTGWVSEVTGYEQLD